MSAGTDIAIRTSCIRNGGFAVDSQPLLFSGNRGACSPRPYKDGELGIRGADIIDHTQFARMFLYEFYFGQ